MYFALIIKINISFFSYINQIFKRSPTKLIKSTGSNGSFMLAKVAEG